jgi:hypothetical protein
MVHRPDIIGTIYNNDAKYDEEGNMTKKPTKQKGFHVNFIQEVPELEQYKLNPQPTTPMRVYAGGIKPVAYKFPSKKKFKEYFPDSDQV